MAFEQVTTPSFFSRYKPLFVGGGVTLILILLSVGGYVLWNIFVPSDTEPPTEYEMVVSNLTDVWNDVKEEIASGDTEQVRRAFETAANETTNPIERTLLLLPIAQITMSENVTEGVQIYKNMVTNPSTPPDLSALALTQLVFSYYNAQSETERKTLTELVFTEEEPFNSFRPLDESLEAREAAYGGLLTTADAQSPTFLSSAYLARHWAKIAFQAHTSANEQLESEARANAQAYVERAKWMLEYAVGPENDLTAPMSEILIRMSNIYVSGMRDGYDVTADIARITAEFEKMHDINTLLAAQYNSVLNVSIPTNTATEKPIHILWRDLLITAVDLLETQTDTSVHIADAYATYITSTRGTAEKAYAESATSDIAPLITQLRSISPTLEGALQK